jgi:hypothetical protein
MFACSLRSANHVRHYSIRVTVTSGWEIRVEQDREVTRLEHSRDWHRVERARASFQREVAELTASGWFVVGGVSGLSAVPAISR